MRDRLSRSRLYGWVERRSVDTIWGLGIPYVLLAALTALTLPWHTARGDTLLLDLSLSALAAGWMLWLLHPAWRQRTPYREVFVAGLIAITTLLVLRDSTFGFYISVDFFYARRMLRWPRQLAAAAAIAVLAALSQTEDGHQSLLFHLTIFVFALAVDLLLLCGLTWLLWERDDQAAQHRRSLADLSKANRRLETTIAENESLHQRLIAGAHEAGIFDERQRMAREIHDTLAQGLTGIVTQLQAAEQAADDPASWRRHLATATQLARESLTEARRSVDALRPMSLEIGRLAEALADVAGRWSALNEIPVQVTTTGTTRPISPEIEFGLLRAAQEALANVAKHAQASRVGLTLSYMESEIALDVRDDGVGFDPILPDRDGFGLVAMRQRIEGLSGTLQVESEPDGGTAVSACVPTVRSLARA
jgi:signal transduction histidine kinase